MGLRKLKKYKKQFTILTKTYNFSEPIQILVDANTILEADRINYDLIKAINTHIPYDTHLFISQCCIENLYKSRNENAIGVAKNMQKRFCHHKEPLPSKECIKSVVDHKGENKYRFVVVTQNDKLRDELRKLPAMPMFFMKKGVLVMEPLSKTTKKIADYVNTKKLTHGLNHISAGKRSLDDDQGGDDEDNDNDDSTKQPKKKKKVKGVNPLAMKRKQKKTVSDESKELSNEEPKKSRRRKHKKPSSDKEQSAIPILVNNEDNKNVEDASVN